MCKNQDIKFGKKCELEILKELHKTNKNIEQHKWIFSPMDFFEKDNNDNIICEYELKSRNINHNKYPSLPFGYNKFRHSRKQIKKGIKQVYIWNCLDGIYYWILYDKKEQKKNNEYYIQKIQNKQRNEKADKGIYIYTEFIKKYNGIEKI